MPLADPESPAAPAIGIMKGGALFLLSFAEKKEPMKLLKSRACLRAPDRGNEKTQTMMVGPGRDRLSDRGSIPLSSSLIG